MYIVNSVFLLLYTVVMIGFEDVMYDIRENNSVSVTVCASVRPLPFLNKTVQVNLTSADGTAMGK